MEWQPMETAPKDGTPVLVRLVEEIALLGEVYNLGPPGRGRVTIAWYDAPTFKDEMGKGDWCCVHLEAGCPDTQGIFYYFPLRVAPTGWMPLPVA